MYRIASTLLLSALVANAAPAAAQEMSNKPVCSATVAPTGELAPWANPAPMKAGSDAAKTPALVAGKAVNLTLLSTPDVHYALRPEKPGGSVSYGGMLAFEVTRAGTYRFAQSSAAWLDVIGKDGAQRSTAHGHGPDCTGIRKMVDFDLAPGRYTIQISANGSADITFLAAAMK